ncbi:Histone-lysine N-methyltransferase, H3 lysine-79 specific [Balamuthia mandrillaris]
MLQQKRSRPPPLDKEMPHQTRKEQLEPPTQQEEKERENKRQKSKPEAKRNNEAQRFDDQEDGEDKNGRRGLSVESKLRALENVFSSLSVNGYQIAQKAKEERRAKQSFQPSLTYGEVNLCAFARFWDDHLLPLLRPLRQQRHQQEQEEGLVFYDIGSGTGKAVLMVATMYSTLFRRCCGIELVPELHAAALSVKEAFLAQQQRRRQEEQEKAQDEGGSTEHLKKEETEADEEVEIEVVEGDSMKAEWEKEADVVFVPATCFTEEMMEQVREKVMKLRAGSLVLCQTTPLWSEEKSKKKQKRRERREEQEEEEGAEAERVNCRSAFRLCGKERCRYGVKAGSATFYIYQKTR